MSSLHEIMENVTPQTPKRKAEVRNNFNHAEGFFGVPLDHECPIIVCDCLAYLRNRGFYEIGVFRVPGNSDMVTSLKEAYNEHFRTANQKRTNSYSVLNSFKPAPSVNDVASLLKAFFTDLDEPIFPANFTQALFDVKSLGLPKVKEIKCYSKIIKNMPSPNRECLSFLISFLRELCAFRKFNNMNAENLATCFVLSLMGKGDAGQQIRMVGQGTVVLKNLIAEETRLYMPSVRNVQANTKYHDVAAQNGPPPIVNARPPVAKALPALPTTGRVQPQEMNAPPQAPAPPPKRVHKYDGLGEPNIVTTNFSNSRTTTSDAAFSSHTHGTKDMF